MKNSEYKIIIICCLMSVFALLLLGCNKGDVKASPSLDRAQILEIAHKCYADVRYSDLIDTPNFSARFSNGIPFYASWISGSVSPTTETLLFHVGKVKRIAYEKWAYNPEANETLNVLGIESPVTSGTSLLIMAKIDGQVLKDERSSVTKVIKAEIERFLNRIHELN